MYMESMNSILSSKFSLIINRINHNNFNLFQMVLTSRSRHHANSGGLFETGKGPCPSTACFSLGPRASHTTASRQLQEVVMIPPFSSPRTCFTNFTMKAGTPCEMESLQQTVAMQHTTLSCAPHSVRPPKIQGSRSLTNNSARRACP